MPSSPVRRSLPPLWVARGQCIAHYGAGEAYLPVLDALGRLCREPGSEPLLTALAQHAPTWLAQMPSLLGAAELEALQRRVQGASRERMLRELTEAVEVLTVERPLILVLEDLHWSDYATLDLVSWLAQRQEPARLLVLGTYRPVDVIVRWPSPAGRQARIAAASAMCELPLELLTAADVAQYLAARFAVDTPLTASFQALAQAILPAHGRASAVHGHGGGCSGPAATVWLNETGGWEVQEGLEKVALEVPESLQQLVEQQLSQLSPEDQRVLEAGSVAGMQFSAAAVAAGLEERGRRGRGTVFDLSTARAISAVKRHRGVAGRNGGGMLSVPPYAVSTSGIRSSAGGEAYPTPCSYWRACGGRLSGAGCGACG